MYIFCFTPNHVLLLHWHVFGHYCIVTVINALKRMLNMKKKHVCVNDMVLINGLEYVRQFVKITLEY